MFSNKSLSDILDSAVSEDKKIVVMARFVPELNDIQKLLEQKGIGYAVVRGGVKNREEEIRRFLKTSHGVKEKGSRMERCE